MINLRKIILILTCTTFSSVAFGVDVGSIKGQINYCGQGGVEGMTIYIPGRQYSVITDATGQFTFDFVPVGQYVIRIRNKFKTLKIDIGVLVNEDSVTDLKIVKICEQSIVTKPPTSISKNPKIKPDSSTSSAISKNILKNKDLDRDGYYAQQDCDDNDPLVNPGANDVCDGKDNNCNGIVDENAVYLLGNGLGSCEDGVIQVDKCSEGFSDCDGNPSNGCEIDINNDNENCGGCSNSCASLEICAQGVC